MSPTENIGGIHPTGVYCRHPPRLASAGCRGARVR